ncbi:Bug family tripartite tricarboxylate transporter substrate binding protein [Pigmentiphaga humi]|uniref:Bug family tripartite tricarboxylate transporter substrate binding protein n=1 Tax=Pigmentiphaga humi TaxID=2478468 RepID=UPI001359AD76|nr:tripartite tricarboxylate transporter substrate binding protein [Pigmentiphaga humi]
MKIIVPFPPGALTDSLARQLAGRLQEAWHQPVVVENRAGASGNIGAESVYRAAPDGYTLLFTPHATLTLAKMLTPQIAFDPDAMTPVSMVTRSIVLLLASSKVPADNVAQLVAYAKANPGKLNFASTGVGSTAHLANELFFRMAGVSGVNVPYQGVAPATTALLGGEVDLFFDAMGNSLPNIRAGKLKVIGVAADRRNDALPGVATVGEALPGFSVPLWTGLACPPKTPAPLAEGIAREVGRALTHPDFARRFANTPGLEAVGSTPAEMQRAVEAERARWADIIKLTTVKGA